MKCNVCGKDSETGFNTTSGDFVCWECGQNTELTMCSKCDTIIESGDPYLKLSAGEYLCGHCAWVFRG